MKHKPRKKMMCETCTEHFGRLMFRTSMGTTQAVCMSCRTVADYVPTHKVEPKKHGKFRIIEKVRIKGLKQEESDVESQLS